VPSSQGTHPLVTLLHVRWFVQVCYPPILQREHLYECQDFANNFRNMLRCNMCSVRYGAGQGGFSRARPRPYTGPGGYFSGNPRPAPVRGPPALIPWTGPRLLPPILTGDRSGVWVGRGPERGQGQGMPKKTPRPRPLSGAGRGKGLGARVFRGPVRPVMNSKHV